MTIKQYSVSIALSTLVLHNPQTAKPGNKFKEQIAFYSSKRKKVESDHEAIAELEFRAGLYVDRDMEVILPGRLFEAMIAEGAKLSKEGRIALSSTFVDNDARICYDGGPLSVEELVADKRFWSQELVRVGTNKVLRTRPFFENVRADFTVSLNGTIANAAQLRTWIDAGLNQKGLGDWRPRNGRGYVTAFEEALQPLKVAA